MSHNNAILIKYIFFNNNNFKDLDLKNVNLRKSPKKQNSLLRISQDKEAGYN